MEVPHYLESDGRELKHSEVPHSRAWNLEVTQIYEARGLAISWKGKPLFLDGRGVKVAIADTGIDDSNPDLEGRVVGGVNCIHGFQSGFNDYDGHGTWVAGLVGGRNEHRGIAPGAELYSVKVSERRNEGETPYLRRGLLWAIDNGMDIVVVPNSTDGEQVPLKEACREATKKGIIVVSSAGNYTCAARWPAGWSRDFSVSVGSVELKEKTKRVYDSTAEDTEHCMRSNKWPYTDFVAPGKNIVSAWLGDKYYIGSGTSIATPHVAGILALGISIARQAGLGVEKKEMVSVLEESSFHYRDIDSCLIAHYLRELIDPESRIFRDDQEMLNAM